jgi:hypothetical protein
MRHDLGQEAAASGNGGAGEAGISSVDAAEAIGAFRIDETTTATPALNPNLG